MLVFATSDKGGTGRSVTSTNILYRTALTGADACYVDFDFGSPTSGAIFGVDGLTRGTASGRGLHSYLLGRVGEPEFCDLWKATDRAELRRRPAGAGRIVLLPGDAGGAEFSTEPQEIVQRCRALFQRLEEEFELTVVDLSAGRSYALTMVLAITGGLDGAFTDSRWLVFHRWTLQHVHAAASLVYDDRGILDTAVKLGHDREELLDRIRFVRTAVIDPEAPDQAGLRPAQLAWLQERDHQLQVLAGALQLGRAMLLGSVPLDPVLQWREQLLTDRDLDTLKIANPATGKALTELAERVTAPGAWQRL